MNISDYKKTLPPVIMQSHLDSQLDLIHKTQEVLEFYADGMLAIWKGKIPKDPALVQIGYINQHLKAPIKQRNFGLTIHANLPTIRKNLSLVEKEVRFGNNDVIVNKGMSMKQLALLIAIDSMYKFQIGTIRTYMYSLHPFMLADLKAHIAKATAKEEAEFLKLREGYINVANACMLPEAEFKSVLVGATNVTVTAANAALMHDDLHTSTKQVLAHTSTSSFNGNPIMWVRSAFIGLFTDSYHELDDKRRYLELSLRQLENEKRKNKDPAIDKEMEMIKERIRAANYKMKKIMENTNGQ